MSLTPVVQIGQRVAIRVITGEVERKFSGFVCSTDERQGIISIEIQDLPVYKATSFLGKQATLVGRSPDSDLDFPCTVIDEFHFPFLVCQKVNRRNNVRVNACLQVTYRKVDQNAYAADPESCLVTAREEMKEPTGSMNLMIHGLDHQNLNPEALSLLPRIDRKLDQIIHLLGKSRSGPPEEPTEVNISGSGIRFTVQEEMQAGQRLAVRILLPLSPPVSVVALGETIRVHEREPREWEIALKFTLISELDREKIIHYVFKRIRELARGSKNEDAKFQAQVGPSRSSNGKAKDFRLLK